MCVCVYVCVCKCVRMWKVIRKRYENNHIRRRNDTGRTRCPQLETKERERERERNKEEEEPKEEEEESEEEEEEPEEEESKENSFQRWNPYFYFKYHGYLINYIELVSLDLLETLFWRPFRTWGGGTRGGASKSLKMKWTSPLVERHSTGPWKPMRFWDIKTTKLD